MKVNEVDPQDKNVIRDEFGSLEEFAEYASRSISERYPGGMREQLGRDYFYGKYCPTPGAVMTMARDGWDTFLDETIDMAHHAVTTVEGDTEVDLFTPVWDVTGSIVDVGEYLAGTPECMIEMPPAKTTRFGRVVTLVASTSYSGAVSSETMVKRGKLIAALALELSRLGIGLELWADFSAAENSWGAGKTLHSRVLVKGANDILDPSKVLFAYAHPGMLRVLAMTAMHNLPISFRSSLRVGTSYGMPEAPERNLPEGTIYLPEVYSDHDVPEAVPELRRLLTELGLVNE